MNCKGGSYILSCWIPLSLCIHNFGCNLIFLHIVIIKKHYCETKRIKFSLLQVAKPWVLTSWICIYACLSSPWKYKHQRPWRIHLIGIKLWVRISKSDLFTQRLSEYLKLTKILIVSMLGFIEGECVFFTLTFLKEKSCN